MDRLMTMQVFVRVVETGSFSKAAAELGTTQPTATKAVAEAERRLGVRLLHRSTRGVTPTEAGLLYYERCKNVVREADEADNVAALVQAGGSGLLRVNTSVAFGRRVLVPLVLRYMRAHPRLQIELLCDDRYVNLVEQGADLAVRMGRLADSSLGARYLGRNPWMLAGAPAYLRAHGTPAAPQDLARHACLVYSSVQGDARWDFVAPGGGACAVPVQGPLRSNNLSAVLAACRAGMGLAVLPWYVARDSVRDGALVQLLPDHALPAQEVHAVFPSPRLVPAKVTAFIGWLQQQLQGEWWLREVSTQDGGP
ncbi:LysR substrate-binding domain-containing protein [Pseudorhodoferax sp.]|uniref:LysR family transcriptional regulator n=1 Tax=Pseudorhodoferax sp. TaxID=1993553 RepID=UPI0039E3A635